MQTEELKEKIKNRTLTPQEEREEERKAEKEKRSKKTWIRTEADADGYFLLKLVKLIDNNDMFLTANNASSLTIARKFLVIHYCEKLTVIIFFA